MDKPEKLLTTKDLADRWTLNSGSIENWRNAGKGPKYLRLGVGYTCVIRYRLKDVLRWEKQNEQIPEPKYKGGS